MTAPVRKQATAPVKPTKPALTAVATNAQASRPVSAHDVLTAAANAIDDRGRQRDSSAAKQERSMASTVAAFNAIEGTSLTERQGWAFMQVVKMTRAAATDRNGGFNPDDALDGAAYAALGGEAAAAAADMTVQE